MLDALRIVPSLVQWICDRLFAPREEGSAKSTRTTRVDVRNGDACIMGASREHSLKSEATKATYTGAVNVVELIYCTYWKLEG